MIKHGRYLQLVNADERLSALDEVRLARLARDGNRVAIDKLVCSNIRLLYSMARKFEYALLLDGDDLVQEGVFGLLRAVEDFDPELHGTRFSTYAGYWINHYMQRAVSQDDPIIRVPKYLAQVRNLISRRELEFRDLSDVEVAERLSVGRKIRVKTLWVRRARELLQRASWDERDDRSGVWVSRELSAGEEVMPDVRTEQILLLIDDLEPLQRWLLRRRFGFTKSAWVGRTRKLSDRQAMQIKEIAVDCGFSRCWVGKLIHSASARIGGLLKAG